MSPPSPAGMLARPAEAVYGAAVSFRNRLFDRGWRRARCTARPVVSVGNLTAGGTGKTPMVAHLAEGLAAAGTRPAVLTRGYRGGDEARELEARLGPGVPVAADPRRARAAERLLARDPAIGAFLLDDGFQHRGLGRDLDLVLVDATAPFGGDRLLPGGRLREPARALARADAVIVTRAESLDPCARNVLDERIAAAHGARPIAHTSPRWSGWRDAAGTNWPVDALAERRVAGACGLGNPDAFAAMLRRHARALVRFEPFPDHHAYRDREIAAVLARAARAGAEVVVVSPKDWVKWRGRLPRDAALPVYRPELELAFRAGAEALWQRVRAAVGAPGHGIAR